MACHEVAALRLGLMQVLGRQDEAERAHERSELGKAADSPGPIRSLAEAKDLAGLKRSYQLAVSRLEEKVAAAKPDDAQRPYLQALVILTKKVELDLDNQIEQLTRFFRDLERMHDFVHEIYPE